ncbi:MAG: dienelactone hydrolase family protein [Deltaproteobacteria bacterium]|nr:dienelactone hydrolase family protein [Deltaproteobacteria bacterium]
MKVALRSIVFFLFWASVAQAEIVTERVLYKDGDTELEGIRAYDNALSGKRPGVLVIQEWWGINEYIERRAKEYAALGYVAFAPDMYGKGRRAKTPEEAKQLSAPFYADRNLFRKRAQAGLSVLVKDPLVDYEKLAAVGYCFGGTAALELARSGVDLDGTIVFHGGLSSPQPQDAQNIKGSVLVMVGAEDPFIPTPEREAFKKEMDDAHVRYEYIEYPSAVHAFTNPAADTLHQPGIAYHKSADEDSFGRSKEFLAALFPKAG